VQSLWVNTIYPIITLCRLFLRKYTTERQVVILKYMPILGYAFKITNIYLNYIKKEVILKILSVYGFTIIYKHVINFLYIYYALIL